MVETILIYLLTTLILYLSAQTAVRKNNYRYVIWGVAFYALVMGVRYGVGKDYYAYLDMYNNALYGDFYERIELGFNWYMQSLAAVGAPQWIFFGLIAFAQLYLIFYSVRNNIEIYPYLVLTFMLGGTWLTYANGLRQQLAFCILALGVPNINEENWAKSFIKYIIIVGIACCFHKSAILTLLFFPVFRYKDSYFKNIPLELIVLFIAIIFSNTNIASQISGGIEDILTLLHYDNYLDDPDSEIMHKHIERIGIGYYVHLFIIITIIAISNDVKKFYNSSKINIIFDLTFIGFIMRYLFMDSIAFGRISYYFIGFQYIFAALCLYYLRKSKRTTLFDILLSLYFLVFVAGMYRMEETTAYFQFYWNDTLQYAH